MASAWEVRPLYCSAAQYYLYSSTTFILLDLSPCAGIEPDLYTLEPKVADLYTFDLWRFEVGTPVLDKGAFCVLRPGPPPCAGPGREPPVLTWPFMEGYL